MFRRGYKARCVRALRVRSWKRVPMKLLKWGRKMPSTKQYNLVPNDDFDTRIPLHPDEAFHYGITFQAKEVVQIAIHKRSTSFTWTNCLICHRPFRDAAIDVDRRD
ncbi:unnamed protein product [Diatraea saccharalis]|uniref:Uncharacterized protein n=1 Tax=Diatraea saccharalis TaxID=40085 RepID=A0A9N9QKU1_9NEOP|nr:unnamed protein product [Diatraea saccharalis]